MFYCIILDESFLDDKLLSACKYLIFYTHTKHKQYKYVFITNG